MDDIIRIGLVQMAVAYVFILALLAMVRARGIGREKEILIATFRMTVQLVLVGFLLAYIFENAHPVYTIVAIIAMEAFAVHNIWQRTKRPLTSALRQVILVSMVTGTMVSLLFFLVAVIRLTPWWEPRYFIPLAGMIIGNSMTGIALGVNSMLEGMYARKALVEGALMLGAKPPMAVREIVNNSFDAAILPTINSMVGMGIVFLPGMMTGQILSGVSPFTAIEYQIAIMLAIVGGVSLTVMMFLQLGYRTFFNDRQQLVLADDE